MSDAIRNFQLFVSSPMDARFERTRLERVVERLNGEFHGVARLTTIRWENEFYKAHETFQAQIPQAANCDLVVAIFRARLGTELPGDFPRMADDRSYPSGSAYEVLSAIKASKKRGAPDVYVFRFPEPPLVQLDDPRRAETELQWERLKAFIETWFRSSSGQFRAGFQTFTSIDDFEAQADALLRKWLGEKVLHGRPAVWPVSLKGSPFRGLAAFGPKHALVFFGRNRDIAKATDRLKDAAERGCPFLLVDGPSGSGKSSLVRAGLLPRLTTAGVIPSIDVWRVAVMRPGELSADPFAALARALFVRTEDLADDEEGRPEALPELGASDFETPADLAALLAHGDDTAIKPILRILGAIEHAFRQKEGFDRDVKAALLLVVDQLDELFGDGTGDDARMRFAKLLSLLARSGRVWVVATLRADLFDRFLEHGELRRLKEDGGSFDLGPPDTAELAEIVRGPAAAANLVYEIDAVTGEQLDERLLKDADRPDLLPLLQFTLNRLFEARETLLDQTRLTFEAYRTLRGIEGAVESEAETALAALGRLEQARLPRLLRELVAPAQARDAGVSVGRAGYNIRSVPRADVAYDEASAKLVRALVDARILLSSGEAGHATVRLAHARVLDCWGRAKSVVAENSDFYRIRADVEAQLQRWEAAGSSRDLLVGAGRPLAEAESLVRRFPEELPRATRDFIKRSGRRARLRQTLSFAAALLFAIVAIAALVAQQQVVRAQKLAEEQRRSAEQALAATTQFADTVVFDGEQGPGALPIKSMRRIFDRAIQGYDQVITLNPTATAYNGRGLAYYSEQNYDQAISDFDQAIVLDPQYAFAFNNRGRAHYAKKDYDHAISNYDEAIRLDPKYSFAFTNRGRASRGTTIMPSRTTTRRLCWIRRAPSRSFTVAARTAPRVTSTAPSRITTVRLCSIRKTQSRSIISATPTTKKKTIAPQLRITIVQLFSTRSTPPRSVLAAMPTPPKAIRTAPSRTTTRRLCSSRNTPAHSTTVGSLIAPKAT
jgi:eukaryotic-like serine/threonine-protein kinase